METFGRFLGVTLVRIGASALAAYALGDLHVALPFGTRWVASFVLLTVLAANTPLGKRES